MTKAFYVRGALIALIAITATCAREQGLGTDSETHFLRACDSSTQCGLASCICGVCTAECSEANPCGAGASAVPAGELVQCVSASDSTCKTQQVCDVSCTSTAECALLGDGYTCSSGRCRALAATAQKQDSKLPLPRSEQQPCAATSDCVDGLVCSQKVCLKDPCTAASCAPLPIAPDKHPCLAATATRGACDNGTCPGGLVCHIDDTCIERGACDAEGLATLAADASPAGVFAVDANYVYGYDATAQRILRWEIATGNMAVLADSISAGHMTSLGMVADDQAIYWTGSQPALESTELPLWRLNLTEGSAPEQLGNGGSVLAQDVGHLYLSSADDATVYRIRKDNPSLRDVVYVAGPSHTLQAIAANSTTIVVSERDGTVHKIDNRTLQAVVLPETADQRSYSGAHLIADDDYCFLLGLSTFRYNFSTDRLIDLQWNSLFSPYAGAPIDGRLYGFGESGVGDSTVFYVDMVSGEMKDLHHVTGSIVSAPSVESRSGIFFVVGKRLVRSVLAAK